MKRNYPTCLRHVCHQPAIMMLSNRYIPKYEVSMKTLSIAILIVSTTLYPSQDDTGLKRIFRRSSISEPVGHPSVPLLHTPPPDHKPVEFTCESARYQASPGARWLFEKIIRSTRLEKNLSRLDIETYEKAFNYTPHADDPKIPDEQERRRLCDLNKCLKVFLSGAHEHLEKAVAEGDLKRQELVRDMEHERRRLLQQLETTQMFHNIEKDKCREKDETTKQILQLHVENTRLIHMTLGISSVIAFASMGVTAYSIMKNGKIRS